MPYIAMYVGNYKLGTTVNIGRETVYDNASDVLNTLKPGWFNPKDTWIYYGEKINETQFKVLDRPCRVDRINTYKVYS